MRLGTRAGCTHLQVGNGLDPPISGKLWVSFAKWSFLGISLLFSNFRPWFADKAGCDRIPLLCCRGTGTWSDALALFNGHGGANALIADSDCSWARDWVPNCSQLSALMEVPFFFKDLLEGCSSWMRLTCCVWSCWCVRTWAVEIS